jgi:hypothetical protein
MCRAGIGQRDTDRSFGAQDGAHVAAALAQTAVGWLVQLSPYAVPLRGEQTGEHAMAQDAEGRTVDLHPAISTRRSFTIVESEVARRPVIAAVQRILERVQASPGQ